METSVERPKAGKEIRFMPEEECVLCHKKLGYLKNLPVNRRPNYIEGAGDLCDKCIKLLWQ